MNREIKFRAINSKYYDFKEKKGRIKWEFGFYATCILPLVDNGKESHRIFVTDKEDKNNGSALVIPETVCQFTGLKDKNGIEIYEGDIVEVYGYSKGACFDDEGYSYTLTGYINYMPSKGFYLKIHKRWDTDNDVEIKGKSKIGHICQSSCNKLGNIFESPELLNK